MHYEILPIVNQKKYKGKPITEMMRDEAYIETIKNENWFKKDELVYEICIHKKLYKISKRDIERNISLFTKERIINLIKHLYPSSENKYIELGPFEWNGIFDWDLIIKDISFESSFASKCESEPNKKKYIPNLYCCFETKINDNNYTSLLKKLLLPIALTDCENQIQMQKCYENICKQNSNDKNKSKKDCLRTRFLSDVRKQAVSKLTYPFMAKYILLVEKCESKYMLLPDLKSIFKQNNIELIIMNEINVNKEENATKLITESKVFEKTCNENNLTKEIYSDLNQTHLYQCKINELEKENSVLKTNINILVVILIFNGLFWLF